MGFGIKKIVKKITKAGLRAGAAMVTGGASELYSGYSDAKKDAAQAQSDFSAYKKNTEEQNREAFGYGSISELIEAQKRKTAELEERKKATGLSSLIGQGTTLG